LKEYVLDILVVLIHDLVDEQLRVRLVMLVMNIFHHLFANNNADELYGRHVDFVQVKLQKRSHPGTAVHLFSALIC
jgi:hypothetical protein